MSQDQQPQRPLDAEHEQWTQQIPDFYQLQGRGDVDEDVH